MRPKFSAQTIEQRWFTVGRPLNRAVYCDKRFSSMGSGVTASMA